MTLHSAGVGIELRGTWDRSTGFVDGGGGSCAVVSASGASGGGTYADQVRSGRNERRGGVVLPVPLARRGPRVTPGSEHRERPDHVPRVDGVRPRSGDCRGVHGGGTEPAAALVPGVASGSTATGRGQDHGTGERRSGSSRDAASTRGDDSGRAGVRQRYTPPGARLGAEPGGLHPALRRRQTGPNLHQGRGRCFRALRRPSQTPHPQRSPPPWCSQTEERPAGAPRRRPRAERSDDQ
jgi:hypothetical protein